MMIFWIQFETLVKVFLGQLIFYNSFLLLQFQQKITLPSYETIMSVGSRVTEKPQVFQRVSCGNSNKRIVKTTCKTFY